MKKKRASFKARHASNIKKGPMSAAYWANRVKWWIVAVKKAAPKRLTVAQKYSQLKRHTEDAGMKVTERNGRIVVTKTRKGKWDASSWWEEVSVHEGWDGCR